MVIVLKNRSNQIGSNEIRIRRELPVFPYNSIRGILIFLASLDEKTI